MPSLVIMMIFTGMPIFIAVSNTLSSFLNMRVGIQSCGALSSLIFQKAQRLPVGSLSNAPVLKDVKAGAARAHQLMEDELRKKTLAAQPLSSSESEVTASEDESDSD